MLRGDVHSQIPYFTKFGQDDTVHPILAALAKLVYEGSGAKDLVGITRALGGDSESGPAPGELPFSAGFRMGGWGPNAPIPPLGREGLAARIAAERKLNLDVEDAAFAARPSAEVIPLRPPMPDLKTILASNPRAATRQLTNRDVPSSRQMAPRARPAPPKPKKKPLVHAATEARRLKEERNRRGGR